MDNWTHMRIYGITFISKIICLLIRLLLFSRTFRHIVSVVHVANLFCVPNPIILNYIISNDQS